MIPTNMCLYVVMDGAVNVPYVCKYLSTYVPSSQSLGSTFNVSVVCVASLAPI